MPDETPVPDEPTYQFVTYETLDEGRIAHALKFLIGSDIAGANVLDSSFFETEIAISLHHCGRSAAHLQQLRDSGQPDQVLLLLRRSAGRDLSDVSLPCRVDAQELAGVRICPA